MNALDAAIRRLNVIIEKESDYAQALSVYKVILDSWRAFLGQGGRTAQLRSLCDEIVAPAGAMTRLRDGAPILEQSCFLLVAPFANDFFEFLLGAVEIAGDMSDEVGVGQVGNLPYMEAIRNESLRLVICSAAEVIYGKVSDEWRKTRDENGVIERCSTGVRDSDTPILQHSNAPALQHVRRKAKEERGKAAHRTVNDANPFDNQWMRNYCPICGSAPSLAALLEDSSGEASTQTRFLLCSFCATVWRYKRIGCARCECEDQHCLHYLSVDSSSATGPVEDESIYRIDLCDKCQGYVKTVVRLPLSAPRTRQDIAPVLHVEDVATPHLDVIAAQRGYAADLPAAHSFAKKV